MDYAFIRLGIRGATEGKLILDERYEDNMEGALENGIRTGVYFFTQALNKEEAVEEADRCVHCFLRKDKRSGIYSDDIWQFKNFSADAGYGAVGSV